jgi:TolB-like protein
MYEMLTGQLPFRGEHEQAIVYSILNKKPKPLAELRSEIPVSIGQVVEKALEKNPDKRYQKAEELLDDLESISAGIVPEEIIARLRKAKLRKRKRAFLYGGSVGLVILAVLALIFFMGRAEAIDSIAVLPLENLTGDAERDYFVDGVTDELIGQLGQISGLRRVTSRTSAMRYKDTDKSLKEIARELNVDAVVEGTVYQVGENVRLRLQLIDVLPEERNLWAQTYERPAKDVLVMYSEMARAIAENTKVELTADETTRLASSRQVNPEAYDAYIKGIFHWQRFNLEDLEAARQYFESALEKDPDYALAHTGISLVWHVYAVAGVVPANEAAPKALAAAERAVELDDTLAEAHYALAVIKYLMEWDWERAEASFRKAIELNPNYPDARGYYSNFLFMMHRQDEAIVQMERMMELDPFNPLFQCFYGASLLFMRRYDEAIEQFQKTLRIVPNHGVATDMLAGAFHHKRMYEDAFEQLKVYYESMDFEEGIKALTRGYEEAGYQGALKSAAEIWEEIAQVTYILPWNIAVLYVFAGNKEKALEWLEKGFEVRDPNMVVIGVIPEIIDLLGDEPRYQELLRKMNLPVDEKE